MKAIGHAVSSILEALMVAVLSWPWMIAGLFAGPDGGLLCFLEAVEEEADAGLMGHFPSALDQLCSCLSPTTIIPSINVSLPINSHPSIVSIIT